MELSPDYARLFLASKINIGEIQWTYLMLSEFRHISLSNWMFTWGISIWQPLIGDRHKMKGRQDAKLLISY